LTNHRIVARPGEPWPDEAFSQTTSGMPDLVHLNRVQGRPDNLPLLSLLEAYRELAERQPGYKVAYEKTLAKLEQADPDHEEVQEGLGKRDLDAGQFSDAIIHLKRAIALAPSRAMPYSYLSQALAQLGQLDVAILASQKAVSLDPYDALYRKVLIDRFIAAKRYDEAVAAMSNYEKLFPEDSFMRKMLELAKQ
jgi:tetratricopeptide (TPR) repeat protein